MKKVFLNCILLLCALIVGSNVVWGVEVMSYTLTPTSGSNNSYSGNCDIAINGITWNLTGNSTTNPWRIGQNKSGTLNASNRVLYSKTAISDDITKIVISHGTKSNITVNSMSVSVHTSEADASSGSNAVATFSPTYTDNGTVTITKTDATSWAGKYYRIVYNLTKTNTNNAGYVQFSGAVFYKEGSASEYAISISGSIANGSVVASASSAETGEEVSLTPTPSAGYEFSSWDVYKTGESSTKVTVTSNKFTMPAYAVTVSATFTELPKYFISTSATNGTITCDDSAWEGKEVTLTATPSPGYGFEAWDVYKTGESSTKVTVTSNKFTMPAYAVTVSATFTELPKYFISTSATNGTITCDDSAWEGKEVTLTANPSDGYALALWVVNKTEDSSTKILVKDGKFTMPGYAVTVTGIFMLSTTDNITVSTTGVDGNSYVAWKDKSLESAAIYAGKSAKGNNAIQLNSTSPNGIISSASGGKARKVTITWESHTTSGRTLDVYGKNSSYSGSANLYGSTSEKGTKLGSIVYGTSTELIIPGDYAFIGLRSSSSAMYISEIAIEWVPCRDFTISAAGWATLYMPFAVDIPSGVKAYYISEISGATLTLAPINGVIPAEMGVLIQAEAGTYTFYKNSGNSTAITPNLLSGSVKNEDTEGAGTGGKYYRLTWDGSDPSSICFAYGATNGVAFTNEANKAYLPLTKAQVDNIPAAAPALHFFIDEENNATNINTIDANEKAVKFIENGQLLIKRDGITYDALGRKVR